MAEYTSLHVVAVNALNWMPEPVFVEEVLHYFHVTSIQSVSGREAPRDLTPGGDNAQYLFGRYNLDSSIADALAIVREQHAPVTLIIAQYRGWDHRLINSLQAIPRALYARFCPDTLSITIGPFVIESWDHESTLGCFGFEVSISGYGMPIEWRAYLEAIRNDPEIRKLLKFLKEHSGKEWEVLISSSY